MDANLTQEDGQEAHPTKEIHTFKTPRLTRDMAKKTDWKNTTILLLLALPIWLLWHTWAIYPVKLLVVFFHELGHAVAAWLTGGRVAGIQLTAAEGGVCVTQGGIRVIVLNAGYLGSALFGGLALLWGTRSRRENGGVMALGIVLSLVALVFIRPVASFGFLFALVAGALCVVSGWRCPRWFNAGVLQVVGLTSCLYALFDVLSDIVWRSHAASDAGRLAQATHVPAIVWGGLWAVLAGALAAWFLFRATRKGSLG